jgi:hypothetical protein
MRGLYRRSRSCGVASDELAATRGGFTLNRKVNMSTTQTIDPDMIEQDAERQLADLKEQAERLAPEALTDETIAQELCGVESEREAAERQLQLARLARSEIDRREQVAKDEAERVAREKLLTQAAKLAARLPAAAQAVDEAAAQLAKAIAAHRDLYDRELALRMEAGVAEQPSGWHRPPYDLALRFALREAGVTDSIEQGPAAAVKPRPLFTQTHNEKE